MTWYVYMLRLRNGLIYVGSTNDLNRRFSEHFRGSGSRACLKSEPIEMIYSEPFPDPASAAAREKQLKGWTRVKKLALAEGQLDELHQLAKRVAK